MKLPLQTLGAVLVAACFVASAHAIPAVIDFEDTVTAPNNRSLSVVPTVAAGDEITTQYARFGLVFTSPNIVNCIRTTTSTPACTAPLAIGAAPHGGSNFLMNQADATTGQFSGFSIEVLDGYALSSLKFDLARNSAPFSVTYFDVNGSQISTPLDRRTPGTFDWTGNVDLGVVDSTVRRIQFGGDGGSSFAIDYMSFDYVTSIANVPEPAALSLVALALVGVGLARRRQA